MNFKNIVAYAVVLSFTANIFSSCSTLKVLKEESKAAHLNRISFTSSSFREYKDKINSLRLKVENLTDYTKETDYDEIITEIEVLISEYKRYTYYFEKARKKKGILVIPPQTLLTLRLNTYCLSSNKSVPDIDEPFVLTKNSPDIPLYQEIMDYTNTITHVTQQFKQELLWNLANKVNWEDLPSEQRQFLAKVDNLASVKITSRFKKSFFRIVGDYLVRAAPFLSKSRDNLSIMEGKAHRFEEYESQLNTVKSKYKKPTVTRPIKADGYDIYTTILTEGYINAEVNFLNVSDKEQEINSYFRPLRKDVQPLGFDVPDWEKIYEEYRNEFVTFMSYLLIKMEYAGPGDMSMTQNNPDRIRDILVAFRDRNKAYKMTEKIFGENNEGDISDAFRHAYWNALMVRDVGSDFAAEVSYYHELNPRNANDPKEKELNKKLREMDLHNNQIGRDIGNHLKNNGITDDKLYADEILKNKYRLIVIYP